MRDKGTASREYLSITQGQCGNGGNISNNTGKSIKAKGIKGKRNGDDVKNGVIGNRVTSSTDKMIKEYRGLTRQKEDKKLVVE